MLPAHVVGQRKRILKLLAGEPDGMTAAAVAEALPDLSFTIVKLRLNNLWLNDKLVKVEDAAGVQRFALKQKRK